jgi:Phage integrase, N-terminal SAM-like domain
MSTDAVSPLRQPMIEDMNARKLSAHTQRSHISSCKRFAAFLRRSPDTATLEDIRLFQLHLAETGASICNRIMTGMRFLYRVTLRRPDLAAEIYHLREPQKIPLVMSPEGDTAPAGRRHEKAQGQSCSASLKQRPADIGDQFHQEWGRLQVPISAGLDLCRQSRQRLR